MTDIVDSLLDLSGKLNMLFGMLGAKGLFDAESMKMLSAPGLDVLQRAAKEIQILRQKS